MSAGVPVSNPTPEPVETATSHTLVFICGLHRSGTSILHRCLSEHPEVSGFAGTGVPEDEGQHLQTVFRPAYEYGGPGKFGFDPEARLDGGSSLVSEENRKRLWSEWSRHWDLQSPVLIEKSPPNLIRAPFLAAMFPGARFIEIQRHPVAVSLATKRWSKTTLRSLLEHWFVCHDRFREDKEGLEHVLTLPYEEFVSAPEEHLARIYRFLGLQPRDTELEVRSDINRKYFDRWSKTRHNPIFRGYVRSLERKFEDRCREYGYSFHTLKGDGLAH